MAGKIIHFFYIDIDTGAYAWASHGLAALCGAVRKAGHDFRITHLTRAMAPAELVRQVAHEPADVYGFSAMTNQFQFVRQYAPALAAATGKPILVGGVHATLAPEEACGVEGVTCACKGDGDVFIQRWLDAYASGADWRSIPGVWYRDNGQIRGVPGECIPDLDSLPYPDYSGFDMARMLRDLSGRLTAVVARGCPFACTFCCNEALRRGYPEKSRYVRFRSPRSAIDLVRGLIDKYRPTSIRFEDDLLLLRPSWRSGFLDLWKAEVALPFECNCRADILTEELAAQLKQAQCLAVDMGIESGDPYIRNQIMGKRVSNEQIVRAFAALHAAGVHTFAYNIVGVPMETKARARRTYELNRRVRPSAGSVFYFFPYPHTRLKEIAEEHHLLREGYDGALSYCDGPSIIEKDITHGELRRIYRKIRIFLLLRKFESYFPLPAAAKRVLSRAAWCVFAVHPPLIDQFLRDTPLKRWLRRCLFAVRHAR